MLAGINCICDLLIMFLTEVNKHWHKDIHHLLGKGQQKSLHNRRVGFLSGSREVIYRISSWRYLPAVQWGNKETNPSTDTLLLLSWMATICIINNLTKTHWANFNPTSLMSLVHWLCGGKYRAETCFWLSSWVQKTLSKIATVGPQPAEAYNQIMGTCYYSLIITVCCLIMHKMSISSF